MNIQDLTVLLAALEIAVKRGTFSVLEIGTIGAVSEKLNTFLKEAKKAQEENAKAEEETATADSDKE